jgi:hypothetical protein
MFTGIWSSLQIEFVAVNEARFYRGVKGFGPEVPRQNCLAQRTGKRSSVLSTPQLAVGSIAPISGKA